MGILNRGFEQGHKRLEWGPYRVVVWADLGVIELISTC